jgi:hypothetical protein
MDLAPQIQWMVVAETLRMRFAVGKKGTCGGGEENGGNAACVSAGDGPLHENSCSI